MKKAKQQFGQKSEALAVEVLKSEGYAIITTNWHCALGELDIVAQKDGVLVFVEVRSRHSHTTETALSSIDNKKRKKLYGAALTYLAEHDLGDAAWRIDVIAIAMPRSGRPLIEHVEDAFDW